VPEGITVLDPGDVGVAMVAIVKIAVPPKEEAAEGEAAVPAEGEEAPRRKPKTDNASDRQMWGVVEFRTDGLGERYLCEICRRIGEPGKTV